MLVATNKELYVTLPKKQKMMLAHSIVNAVRSQIPQGRFLQIDVQHDLWYDVGHKRAQEKTSQALREGAPEIRTKIMSSTTSSSAHTGTCNSGALVTPTEISRSLSSQEITAASSTEDGFNDATKKSDEATSMIEETIETAGDPAMVVPPVVPLGPTTSTEQMPPPSTIPSSTTVSTHNNIDSMKPEMAQSSTAKVTSINTSNTNVPTMVEDNTHDDDDDDVDDDETPLPPPALSAPMPIFYQESYATCSFGSMGLMSDMDQARLMQSFTSTAPSNNYDYCRPSGQNGTTYSTSTVTTNNTTHYHGNPINVNNGVFYNNNSQYHQQQQYQSPSMSQPVYNQYPTQGSNGYDYTQQQQYGQYQNSGVGNYTPAQYHNYPPPIQDVRMPQPVDGGLDPTNGFSIGSMMSIGTCSKLEDAGFSFGSAMSYTPIPLNTTTYLSKPDEQNGGAKHHDPKTAAVQPPDGGLQYVGTSLGSLSIADGERERIISNADRGLARLNAFMNQTNQSSNHTSNNSDIAVPTTFLQQQKSRGSLLACNDEDDEGEDTISAEARSQKGAHEWNRLQATLAMEDQSIRDAVSVPPMFVMNPTNYQRQQQPERSSGYHQNNLDVPTLDRDYSQMSAISVGEDFEAPPMPRMAATTSRYYSSTSTYNNDNTNAVSTDSIENDPNWDQYERGIRQEGIMPPVLKKSCTNRY